ncbi:DMT family transporter [Alkalicoccobacillus porphyridii]|uniref:DMT family transporter n=1 Tax=Alkalicoccobacillus porphyridii TaxID=2597270 RepID=A0A553ZZW1_9BACI|nr:DMT family transporter [Alkalicoccobacillus porphyridii]TSB46980.1 DMT family transporter [Alkalicoccobacillus porphyridii]
MKQPLTSFYHYFAVCIATVLWGVNIVSLKLLVTSFSPVTMTAFRILTAGLFLAGILLLNRKNKRLTRSEWYFILSGGALGVFAHHLFLSIGLTTINASTAVLILGLVPVVTAICSHIFLRESFSLWNVIGISLAFIGVLFVQGGVMEMTTGTMYLLVAVVVQAVSFLFVRKASETVSSIQITAYTLIAGAIMLFLTSMVMEPSGVHSMLVGNISLYSIFLFSAIASTACGQLLFNVSIRHVGPSKSALFLNFVPFFGLVFSYFLLNEVIYWYQWCGFVLIVSGVLFGTGYIEKVWFKSKRVKRMA